MKEYDRVKLCTNKFKNEGVVEGDIGYIIEVYGDGNFEVEFSDEKNGITIAQLVLQKDEIVLSL